MNYVNALEAAIALLNQHIEHYTSALLDDPSDEVIQVDMLMAVAARKAARESLRSLTEPPL